MSREPRDPHTKRRGNEAASGDDEGTLGADTPVDPEVVPEGFHRPNVGPRPAEEAADGAPDTAPPKGRSSGHPNDADGEADLDLTMEIELADEEEPLLDGSVAAPSTTGSEQAATAAAGGNAEVKETFESAHAEEDARPADPSAPVTPSDEDGRTDKRQKKAKKDKRQKKAKKDKRAKKDKGQPSDDPRPEEAQGADGEPLSPDAMGLVADADADAVTDDDGTEGGQERPHEIVAGHRFGLRMGSHKAGNLIGKLKARFKKDTESEAEVIEHEIEEAASERIEPDERYKEVETYPIHPPYAYVRILFDDERKDYIYQVLEPLLTKTEEEILTFIENTLVDNLTVSPEELEGADELEFITERFNDVIFDYSIILHEEEDEEDAIKKKLLYYLRRDFIGHGPVDILMNDPYIEDISCDGPSVPIFLYHRKYESMRSTVLFGKHDKLDGYVIKMAQRAGKHISIAEPILDATMADGSRLQATLGTEVSAGGSTFTIRKFRPDPFTPPDLVLFRTMSAEMLAYLWISVQNGASIMYAGGTASGKTTSLNAILLFIPPNMKIVSIEDTREVNLPHENWIAGITRTGFGPRDQFGRQAGEIDMFQLLKNALRQRPEYIIVGEVRGQEAYSLFQAMATGHAAYGTMHADSVDAVIHRLESDPINIPRSLLEALDIVSVQIQTRVDGKRVRRTKQISEIVGLDPHTREILTNEVFRWMPKDDSFRFSGVSYILERIQLEKGMPSGSMVKELRRRAEIIEWMIQMHIQDYQDVSRVVSGYYKEPELILSLVRGEITIEEAPPGLRALASRGTEDGSPLSAAALAAEPGTGNVMDASEQPQEVQGTLAVTAAAHPVAEDAASSETADMAEEGHGQGGSPATSDQTDGSQHSDGPDGPPHGAGSSGPPATRATAPGAARHRPEDADAEDDGAKEGAPLVEPGDTGWDQDAAAAGSGEGGPAQGSSWAPVAKDAGKSEEQHPPGTEGAAAADTSAEPSKPLSSDEGEEWLQKVEAKIRARYEEIEREKEAQEGAASGQEAEASGGDDN